MLGALESSRRAQRQLVADASHELRTPLTSLRTNLEVLGSRRQLPAGDRERLRTDVVAQLEELTELVGDLVELAREDEPCDEPPETLRLDELVAGAVERARRHAPGVAFTTELDPTLVTRRPLAAGPRGRQPARQRGQVEPAGRRGRRAPPRRRADRPRPRSRDRRRRPPARVRPLLPRDRRARAAGSGLGLAIVRAVAERHGGDVTAEPAPGGGAQLRLTLPVSSDS